MRTNELIRHFIVATIVLCGLGVAPAQAASTLFTFTTGSPGNLGVGNTSAPLGIQYGSGNLSFGISAWWIGSTTQQSVYDNTGGLGLTSSDSTDGSGANGYISANDYLMVDFSTLKTQTQYIIQSIQFEFTLVNGYGADVWADNLATKGVLQTNHVVTDDTNGGVLTPLATYPLLAWNNYAYYDVIADCPQILLEGIQINYTTAPEPATYLLAGLALLGLGIARRKK